MTLPSKPVVIRLTPEAAEKFRMLCEEFAGLPQSQVIRYVVESVLNQPFSDQVEILTNQIRKPGAKGPNQKRTSVRIESAIVNRRHGRE